MKRFYLDMDYVNEEIKIKKQCDLNENILNWTDKLEFGPYKDIYNDDYFNIQIFIQNRYLSENTNTLESINDYEKQYYKLPYFLEKSTLLNLNWFKIPIKDKDIKTIIKSYNLNYGGTSLVFRGIRKKDQVSVAFKIFNKDINFNIYQNEIKILEIFKRNGYHPNIIEMYENGFIDQELFNNFEIPFFINKDVFLGSKYILLEWIEGLELFEYISNNKILSDNIYTFKENTNILKNIINQLLDGIRWANEECQVINEDIKLENIMIFEQEECIKIKIIDWGFATTEKVSSKMLGSINYCSPEILSIPIKVYNTKISQMWSLGITIYALVFKGFPFNAATLLEDKRFQEFYKLQQQNNNILDIIEYQKKNYISIIDDKQYLDIFNLINKMLVCDSTKRLNCLNNICLKI